MCGFCECLCVDLCACFLCSSDPFHLLRNILEQRFTRFGGRYFGMKRLYPVAHGQIEGHGEQNGSKT